MPGKIKVKILAGRNLPVMDRSGDTTDAYVEIKFGNTTFKTDVCRKSLNPQWNSEWYRFEVDDAELQDEPLQVRLMDHDTYSANDAIGKVYVNLNPLLLPGLPPTVKNIWTLEATMNSSSGSQGGSVMTGWIPVFDTMHGIRGEVNIIVKVELFSDCNKFRQSSCGVQFFYSPNIPHGYHAQVIHGFVEELVVSDDPEYKWIDKIRTPRASNEARQTLFFKLSGEVQRKIGLKALDLGGNAVIGYVQNFDLEGESGIVARGIGTAVTLVKLQDISSILPLETSNIEELTCFDLQSKNHPDFSESDDSLPLLSHSPNHSPISHSPTNLHATIVSPRFPKYEKARKHPRQAVRVAEYRAAGLRARQFSLQHNAASNSSMRKGTGSSLSLADDLISESSLKNMLALEDMRGEPVGNPFSRGLKNFRYLHQNILPRRVAQIKSKITDSFDDESDPDSTYSSTWSLAGSESNRSPSIVDLRQSIRRKKFTHKKSASDGIAALLIRSVHSGFPLDSVREDRETPTPSPVNFLTDLNEYTDETKRRGIFGNESSGKSETGEIDDDFVENQLLLGKNKHDVKYTAKELLIPMMSSSETDTSTSDEDEPSESSTNYNILDDSYSIVDPSSNDDGTYQPKFRPNATKGTKIFEKIEKFSDKIEIIAIGSEKNENRPLEPDFSLESSTDYNILDDTNSIIEYGKKIDQNSQQVEKLLSFHSNDRKNIKLDTENEGSHLSALESDCSLKSSPDYNILDDTNSIIEYGEKIDQTSQQDEKLLRFHSNDRKNIKLDTENKGSHLSALESDCSLKSSPDYNILDDTNSIIEYGKKIDQTSQQDEKLLRFHSNDRKNIKLDIENEGSHLTALESDCSLKSSPEYNILDDINSIIEYGEKIDQTTQQDEKLLKFHSNDRKNIKLDTEKEGSNLTALESDCSFKSSPDHNILDETNSNIEHGSVDDKKIDPDPQQVAKSLNIDATLGKFSENPENIMIDTKNEDNCSTALEPACSTESSLDQNILDRTESLIVKHSEHVEKLFDTPADINKFSEKTEIIMIDAKHEESSSNDLVPISNSDYNILDESKSLIENSLIEDRNLEISVPIDAVQLLEIANKLEDVVEKMKDIKIPVPEEENPAICSRKKSSDEIYQYIDHISSEVENLDHSRQQKIQITDLPKDSTTIPPNPTSILESVESNSENNKVDEIKQLKHQSSITLRDCHSTSSTNYNFLDESYSPNESGSVDDGKFDQTLQKPTNDSEFPEIQNTSKIALSTSDQIEKTQRTEETTNESESEENIIFSSQNDSKLESSTDYNILDDVSSLTETHDEKCETSFHRSFDAKEFSEIPSAFISSLVSFQEFQDQSKKQAEANQETKKLTGEENPFSLPESPLNSLPIFPNLDTNLTVYFAGKSTSSGTESSPSTTPTKLKHLKFLPKQKNFDSTEDVGFVTSTPVETEVTLFADFETSQKLSSRHSFDSPKFDFQSSSKSKTSKNEPTEKVLRAESLKLCSEKRIKQICPLGVSFDTIRVLNDRKTAPVSLQTEKTSPISQSVTKETSHKGKKESVIPEPKIAIPKKEKASKKIERTDTVIYKGPPKDRERFTAANREATSSKSQTNSTRRTSPIPIFVAPPPEEHATRLQVPVIQTTNINVQSTFSPDEMKTQHFGSIGSRKFPVDECAISEKFNRKYRQHCILDLIRTIDAKMMVHHMHHERRDSTKSKRKKRDRINASATPSPDSIHRTRPHNHNKRRSRSRSPDRQHVSHPKNHVSSLSTHSFPGNSLRNPSFNQDSTSCNSSCENLSRNIPAPIVVCQKEPNTVCQNDANDSVDSQKNNNQDSQDNQVIVVESPVETLDENLLVKNEVESILATKEISNPTVCMLDPKELEHPVYKSHSAGSLEGLPKKFPVITKNTNTANTIDDLCVPCSPLTLRQQDEQQAAASSPTQATSALPSSLGSKVTPNSSTATKTNTAIPNMHRRSSDSDLSITPKGNSLAGSDRSMGGHMRPSTAIVRTMNQDTMEMLEYPFITMQQYPPGFVLNIGGLVSARSVKLLERITNLEEPEGRDAWWTEIRMEVRSHARALACNVVLGYKEEISICDDVCVLNASGTAAVINLLNASQDQDNVLLSRTLMTTSIESEREKIQAKSFTSKADKSEETSLSGQQTHSSGKVKRTSESNDHEIPYLPTLSACSLCHLPYSEASVPFRVDVSKCAICRRAKVPDVLFTTIELPENIPMTGRGVFLQATVCKSKRDLRGELNAKEISDCLPFLEYELHSLLLNKLKVKGMNAIFGLKVQVSVGERLVIGMAVGTAVYLTALPTPSVPQIASGNSWHNEEQLAEIQKTLIETVKKNREFYRLKPITDIENGRSITTSDTDESDDDLPDLDLGIGTKDACVLEVDDVEDMDRINLLIDEKPPDDFHVVNTQSIPGLEDLEIVRNLQMFTQISRAKIPAGQFASMPSKYFARMLQTVLFKLRRMVPCALCDMQFKVALPEQDEIQLSVVGMALGLGEPTRFSKYKRKLIPNSTSKDPIKKTDDNDMIFSLDEDQADITGPQDSNPVPNQSNSNISSSSPLPGLSAQKHRPRSPFRTKTHMSHRHKHVPLKERYGVDITPLSYLPGGKIERYLGNLNFFFIRESTSIRENGGLSGFTHSFVTEILAIVRAHITALGGNAMVAFFMTQCVLLHSPHKNQGQCLINVGGDVVTVSYYGDDKYQGNQNC